MYDFTRQIGVSLMADYDVMHVLHTMDFMDGHAKDVFETLALPFSVNCILFFLFRVTRP
ncbi:hypothetical protein KUL17_02660 [Alteromonas sp. KUL17]|nr:hypothetical protein KUL17_02660 [Alteromonas sp. KUL17]